MTAIDVPTELEQRTLRAMPRFTPRQRDRFVARIIENDPELASVLPTLLAIYVGAKLTRVPLRRDAVT
jgi:hypothetical protein